ncbi:uncharacterized protein LOC108909041 [Anoplophora glabripennis]|uniref:uncharacterized protein LOC108909041 n=1 Tax=Anoplophora glabripennis TaxID=217634 RepID=UPI000873D480|nr:uncharacterized protein LOC108909041 [Anoplophora glabripennis]
MATYPGMSLRGEVRESISLDEDDLSDVEDEVFIRDGKNGYKLAEELNVKRPLMAPRRKLGKQDIGTRLKNKPPCRAFCKPCCYVSAALAVLIGLIILVVILVSMYPLPLDRFRDWVIKKSHPEDDGRTKLLPCHNLKVTEVWSVTLPKLTTDSPVRSLDVNADGVEDILFGFGTGDNSDVLPPDIFCPVIMSVQPPCEGGVAALNGITGDIIWRHWFNDTIFGLHCTADINGDMQKDCLVTGMKGTIAVINSKNGSVIWQLDTGLSNIFVANFIQDQNNDSVSDILASHSSLTAERDGHIVLFSGKDGHEIKRTSTFDNAKTFYMPQMVSLNSSVFVLFGTGSPSTPGNLSLTPLSDIMMGVFSNQTQVLYRDKFKGIITPSIIVDITGDKVPDIITAMYNSTVVAINGVTLQQIWNYTIPGPNSETSISPTPGYFNYDNVTDFLVIYQKYDSILNNNYTQAFIIDGKTGQSIYSPFGGSLITQMGGLTISMENHGYDMYLFWTAECTNIEMFKKTGVQKGKLGDFYDECRRQFNTTRILKLNVLNQFHQPPGFVIYNSVDHVTKEFGSMKSSLKQVKEFYRSHEKVHIEAAGQSEVDENYSVDAPIGIRKYGTSNFRHKDGRTGIVKDYGPSEVNSPIVEDQDGAISNTDYDWPQNQPSNVLNDLDGLEPEFNNYPIDDSIPYNQKHLLIDESSRKMGSRDPRSKEKTESSNKVDPNSKSNQKEKSRSSTKKKNLSDKKYGIYDYKNLRSAQNRLLHDINNIPTEILKDTFFKNEERRLRKSKFEQRDINAHNDKIKENEDIQSIIEEEKVALQNNSLNLWDLESEKEVQDWESGNYRGKREVNYTFDSVTKITSVGAVVNPFNVSNNTNAIDIVFVTYWQPAILEEDVLLKQDIHDCVEEKLLQKSEDQSHEYPKTMEKDQRASYKRECLAEQANLKNDVAYFQQLFQLRLGQMTVYRLRIECECLSVNTNERCVKFLPKSDQSYPSYLGRNGDGVFFVRD